MSWMSDIRQRLRRPERPYLGLPTLISFGLAILLLLFLATRFDVNLGSTWDKLRASNLLFFALAVVAHYSTFLFRGARWRLLLQNVQEADARVPTTLYCGRLILLGWFVNSITWFRLGDAYRAYAYAGEADQSFSRTIGTVLAERVLDGLVILVLVVVGLLLLLASGVGISWTLIGVVVILVSVLLVVLLAMSQFRSRLAHRLPPRIQEAYQRFHQGTLGSFRQLPMVAVLGLLGWLAEVARLYLVSEAVGVDISIGLVVFVAVANSMLTLIPLTPGGLGLVEPGVVGLLMVSLEKSQAVPVALLDRSISFLSIIVSGAILFLVIEVLKRRRRARNAALAKGG